MTNINHYFRLGYEKGKSIKHHLSIKDAEEMNIPSKHIDVFLNGVDDGIRDDTWRLNNGEPLSTQDDLMLTLGEIVGLQLKP